MPVPPLIPSPRALFLFDLDGTLVRGGDREHWDAFNHALEAVYGVPATLDGVPLGGYLDRQITRAALAPFGLDDAEVTAGLDSVMELMAAKYGELIGPTPAPERLLPGADTCVQACIAAGHLAAVATGSSRGVARQKLAQIGLADLAHGAYGDEVDERPELYSIAEARTTDPYDCVVVVGDTPRDIAAARAADHAVIAVASGRWSEAELAEHGPDLLLPDLTHHHRFSEVVASASP